MKRPADILKYRTAGSVKKKIGISWKMPPVPHGGIYEIVAMRA